MPQKKKTKLAEENDGSGDEEQMDTSDAGQKLLVDFEAFPPCESDLGGIQKLLGQLFLKAKIELREMAKLLISQQPIGCVYRPTDECSMEDSEEDVYGIMSVINLHGQNPSTQALLSHLRKKTEKNCKNADAKRQILAEFLNATSGKVGFIFNERLLNLPYPITLPALKSLIFDLDEETRLDNEDFNLTHFCMLLKIHKKMPTKKQPVDTNVIYSNSEEELLCEECSSSLQFDYAVSSEEGAQTLESTVTDQSATDPADQSESASVMLQPFRRLICFTRAHLDAFAAKLEAEIAK